jgi:hypothetical protein
MMNLHLESDRHGHLVARQTGIGLTRLLIGLPLLASGSLLLYGVISSPIITLSERGTAGLPEAVVACLALLLFAALTFPLGWWLVFSRHWKVLDADAGEIIAISDWRVGRKENRTPLGKFVGLRLAREELLPSSSQSSRQRSVSALIIRLMARDAERQPSIEIGSLEEAQQERALELALQISNYLQLPLKVESMGELSLSPNEEQALRDEAEQEES